LKYQDLVKSHQALSLVSEVAQRLGMEAYVVGGFVRDLLLNVTSKDLDFVCLGSGIELARAVAHQLGEGANLSVFKNFGTAMVKMGDMELEFVGARKESYRRESRKPIVEDGSLQDDQLRRDFTINAMAISLNQADLGKLIDPFNGQQHLQEQLIVTPREPNVTFSDDPLRMMRAIRFATRLGFDIAPDTFDGIITQKERISIVSMERITDELNKIILTPKPSYGFLLLDGSGLLPIIFPEFVKLKGVEKKQGIGHKDNFYHTLKVLDNLCEMSDDLWVRWAALLHDIAKPATKRFHPKAGWTFHGHEELGARMVKPIFKRFKLPLNDKMKQVERLVRFHLRPIALSKDNITDSAIRRLIFEMGDDLEALMKLCRADITSKNKEKVRRYLRNFDKLEKMIAEIEEKDSIRNFQPVISGEVIIQAFGIKPSKVVGDIKNELKEAMLDGKLKNEFAPAYAYMLEVGKAKGLRPVNEH